MKIDSAKNTPSDVFKITEERTNEIEILLQQLYRKSGTIGEFIKLIGKAKLTENELPVAYISLGSFLAIKSMQNDIRSARQKCQVLMEVIVQVSLASKDTVLHDGDSDDEGEDECSCNMAPSSPENGIPLFR